MSQQKQLERLIANKVRDNAMNQPYVDVELTNLRTKVVYLHKKVEEEQQKLLKLSNKKQ